MLIPKPTKPEELYRFFVYGMPLDPTNRTFSLTSTICRKDWNVSIESVHDHWLLSIAYYYNWQQENPNWSLNTLKYI